jgi:hypothetical protein
MDLVGLELRWKCLARVLHLCVWGFEALCHVRRGIANAVNEELESLAVQSQAVNMQHADVSKMLDFEGGKKWYNYGPLDFGLYPFLDNSRMPEDCHPTWKIGGLWRGLAGSLAGLFASWLQWFKVPCFFKRAVMRSGTSGTWPLGTWDPPGAHYVPLVCRPGTDSGTFPPKILCQFESRWVFEIYVLTCRLPSCIKTALWWLPICWTTVLNHCAILLGENHRSFNAVARSWNRQGQSVITAH